MQPPITVWPSANHDTLLHAIREANQTNKRIVLMPGPHLTRPGQNQRVQIGENGLHIRGTLSAGEFSSIRRPDNSIDLDHSDGNYGLFFIPAKPTDEEWQSVETWNSHTDTNENGDVVTFEYTIIIRGVIKIENIELDCNMGKQGLPEVFSSEKIEHSAMLGFAGEKYKNDSFPGKFIFVGFESVILNNIRSTRGGYADDIWISRGYFRPNIGKVSISKITSQNRINNKRATISFSGLTQKVEVRKANIFKLESEETSSRWSELPGDSINSTNQYSFWKLRHIICEVLDLAAKGQGIFVDADDLRSTESTNLYQIGGIIRNSTFNTLPQPTPLNRLNALKFKKVSWIFSSFRNLKGNFVGVSPRPQYGESCSAYFIENTFKLNGELLTDDETEQHCLIQTESSAEPGNVVRLEFRGCSYDERFGNEAKTCVAKVFSSGQWKFKITDFMGIPLEKALVIKPTGTTNITSSYVVINIP